MFEQLENALVEDSVADIPSILNHIAYFYNLPGSTDLKNYFN